MAVLVFSRRGRPLSRFIANPAGDGLLARARALSFALLGLMTAVGLGLVVFISNLGWPNILGGPIPGLPIEHSAVHGRVIASRPTTSNQVPAPGSRSKPAVAPKPSGTGAGLARLRPLRVAQGGRAIAATEPRQRPAFR